VWLIFSLVVLWTAFPTAFAAIMTTLYIPLGLAALGIVLRGSGFAFRKVSVRTSEQRVAGAAFAASSVMTPFFFGTVAGGIASGRVPAAGNGAAIASWWNPTSILGGALAVVVCAYLAAVFLVTDARRRHDHDLELAFRWRAYGAAAAGGVLAIAGIFILRADSHRLFERLLGPALPFVLASAAAGSAVLVLLGIAAPRLLRVLAASAVAAVVGGWGVAQYPYLLGTHVTISQGAAPDATLTAVIVVFVAAVLLIGPSLVLLYILTERGALEPT
jgi:cytochrome d ubiquinol oxidase subunit II